MSLQKDIPQDPSVLFFRPRKNGDQNAESTVPCMGEFVKIMLQSPPALESISPHSSLNVANVFLISNFFGLLIQIAGVEATLLLIDLEHIGSSLVDQFFFWKEINILIDSEGNCEFYRSFICMFLFEYGFITVRKNDRSGFDVTYRTFDNPERFGNPLNGAFPRAVRDPKDDSGTLVELLPFCSPMTLKDATDKSYTFKQLKVYIDPRNSFLVFFFTLVTFDDDKIDGRELDDDSIFEMANFELSFPIKFCKRSISSQIVFEHQEEGDYIASFTIKIGNEDYNVRLYFGTYESYFIDHHDSHYTLSAISDRSTCTTIFCGNTDAEVLMERKMSRVGILAIEIPDFVAPETDDDSAMVDALKPLPEGLQAFLRSITWRNPEAAGSN